jgi:hypothetical protein
MYPSEGSSTTPKRARASRLSGRRPSPHVLKSVPSSCDCGCQTCWTSSHYEHVRCFAHPTSSESDPCGAFSQTKVRARCADADYAERIMQLSPACHFFVARRADPDESVSVGGYRSTSIERDAKTLPRMRVIFPRPVPGRAPLATVLGSLLRTPLRATTRRTRRRIRPAKST